MADEKTFTQADIDAAVSKASAAFDDKIEELTNKYNGAMDDLKKAQREARAAKDITPEAHQAEVDRADKAEADLAEATKQLKAANSAKEKAEKALTEEQGFTSKLLIQDGLKSALISNGVKDEDFLDTLVAKFSRDASIVAEGTDRKVMLGEKALNDAIKDFAASDSGKKFVSAPNNSGGGAGGGKGEGGGKTMTRTAYQELATSDPAKANTFVRDGGTIVDQAA